MADKNFLLRFQIPLIIAALIFININKSSADSFNISYYNPDNNFPASEIIKASSEYFNSMNINTFIQPLAKLENVRQMLDGNSVDYIIISPFFMNILNNKMPLKQLLISADSENSSKYKKILLVRKNSINSIKDLDNKTIASISYGDNGYKIFKNLIYKNSEAQSLVEIIWVKKDLDAIFALNFEQMDGTLVSVNSYELLKKEMPDEIANLKIIAQTDDLPLPCLYAVNSQSDKILPYFLKMSDSVSGNHLLKTLGISVWKAIYEN